MLPLKQIRGPASQAALHTPASPACLSQLVEGAEEGRTQVQADAVTSIEQFMLTRLKDKYFDMCNNTATNERIGLV